MSVKVKICGLKTPEMLEAAIAAGADMAGFVFFEKSPRHLSLEAARDLGGQARGRIEIVALTVDAGDAAIEAIVAALRPDALQLHGRETPERIADIRRRFGLPAMKAYGVSTPVDIAGAFHDGAGADRLLFDAKPPADAPLPGGNGVSFDWRLLRGLPLSKPWLLSGGLTADNVAQAIAESGAPGVDVSSGVESAPGVKDAAKIAAFVAAARG